MSDTKTLTLEEAAEFLKIHPVTLSVKAASGEVPAAKIGRAWVFLEIDLITHIRSKYKMRALESDNGKETLTCHSTNARIPLFGGSKSPSVEKQYKEALGLSQNVKPKNTTTGLKPICGNKSA